MADTKLKRVSISGFRSIRGSVVNLRNINILIGPNGSGKSNFISALYFLQNILDKNLQSTVGRIGLPSLLYRGPKYTKNIEMEFSFGKNSYGFKLDANDEGRLIFADEYYGWGDGRWSIKRNVPFGDESEYEKGVPNMINSYVKPVLEARKWRVYHFHDTTPSSGMKQVGNMSDTVSLHHDASNLAPFLRMLMIYHPKEYSDILRVIRHVAPFFNDFVLEPNAENSELIRLRWRQVGCEEVFGVNQLSDGTLRFICLAVLLLQPPELQPSTIILDEPELGLHPSAIALLADLIHMASRHKQMVISTQSADLLDYFDADDVIVTGMSESGSEYRRLSSKELKSWLEDYALSTVWKKNVFGGQP